MANNRIYICTMGWWEICLRDVNIPKSVGELSSPTNYRRDRGTIDEAVDSHYRSCVVKTNSLQFYSPGYTQGYIVAALSDAECKSS